MSLRILSFVFKVTKIIIIALLLGLGVHFGLVVPRGGYSQASARIFGSQYLSVIKGTLWLYILYRFFLIAARVYFGKEDFRVEKISKTKNLDPAKDNIYYKETLLLLLVGFPIIIGLQLAKSPIDLPKSTFFQILQIVMVFVIISSVKLIYNEDVDFSTSK